MKDYRIEEVIPLRYPIVRVVFEDGLAGEIDFSPEIESDLLFAPLRDAELFSKVSLGAHGRAFGWNLDRVGSEIDVAADQARIEIETQKVHQLAERYRHRRTAAE